MKIRKMFVVMYKHTNNNYLSDIRCLEVHSDAEAARRVKKYLNVYEDYETAAEYVRRCNSDPYNDGTEYMVHEALLVEKEN